MKRLLWGLLPCSAALLTGCGEQQASMPRPPIDDVVPARLETATFALG